MDHMSKLTVSAATIAMITLFMFTFLSYNVLAVNIFPNVSNSTSNPNFSTTLTVIFNNITQENTGYILMLPYMEWSSTGNRPQPIQTGYAMPMNFSRDPFIDFSPDGMFFLSYNIEVNFTNMTTASTGAANRPLYVYLSPNTTWPENSAQRGSNATNQTLTLYSEFNFTMYDFMSNTTRGMRFRFPCPQVQPFTFPGSNILNVLRDTCGPPNSRLVMSFLNNSALAWNDSYNVADWDNLNLGFDYATGNLTVNITNRTTADTWTALRLTFGLFDRSVSANIRAQSQKPPNFLVSPVYLLSQSVAGFDMDSARNPGSAGIFQVIANMTNPLTNYTVNNLFARFIVPLNFTVNYTQNIYGFAPLPAGIKDPYTGSNNTGFSFNVSSGASLAATCVGAGGATTTNSSYNILWQSNASVSQASYEGTRLVPATAIINTIRKINFTSNGDPKGMGTGIGGNKSVYANITIYMADILLNLSAVGCGENNALTSDRLAWNFSTNISVNFTMSYAMPKMSEETRNSSSNDDRAGYNVTIYNTNDNGAVRMSNSSLPGWGAGSGTGGNVSNSSINVTVDGTNIPRCGSTEANLTESSTGSSTCWNETGSISIVGLSAGSHSVSATYLTTTAVSTAGTTTTSSGTSSGGSATAGAVFKTSIQTITSGETKTVSPGDTAGFSSMDILTTETVSNVKFEVGKMTTAPAEVTTPLEGKVNYYVQVNTTGISDSQLSSVKLKFKVTKQWLTDNGVTAEDVALWRFSAGKWTELTTTKTAEGETSISYEATSPGLSTFAVATKSTGATPTAPGEPTAPTGEEKKEEAPVTQNSTLIALVVIIVIIAAVWYTQKKK